VSTAVEVFWSEHQVGGPFDTVEASEAALNARALLFPDLERLMPTSKPGLTVLDYGCGPGHDTVRFLENGAQFVFYADTSPLALQTTAQRLRLHGLDANAEPILVPDGKPPNLPRVDHIHCAGVLHHATLPALILNSFQRSLRPDAEARVMVYDGERSPHTQSKVPVTHWWTHDQVKSLALYAGLFAEYVGGYPCPAEWRPDCEAACFRMWAL